MISPWYVSKSELDCSEIVLPKVRLLWFIVHGRQFFFQICTILCAHIRLAGSCVMEGGVIPDWHSYLSASLYLIRKDQVPSCVTISIHWLLDLSVPGLPYWSSFMILMVLNLVHILSFLSFFTCITWTTYFKCLHINYSLTTVILTTTGVFPSSWALLNYNTLIVFCILKWLTGLVFLTLQYGFNVDYLSIPNQTLLNSFNIDCLFLNCFTLMTWVYLTWHWWLECT